MRDNACRCAVRALLRGGAPLARSVMIRVRAVAWSRRRREPRRPEPADARRPTRERTIYHVYVADSERYQYRVLNRDRLKHYT